MRRLLQFGTILMLIGALYPLLEFFDGWDSSGLFNDTEFAVFALLFALCLVLLVCKLVSSGALGFVFSIWRIFHPDERPQAVEASHAPVFAVPLLFDLPLRI